MEVDKRKRVIWSDETKMNKIVVQMDDREAGEPLQPRSVKQTWRCWPITQNFLLVLYIYILALSIPL